ncbi:MAG: hypothetical protein FWD36_03670, partial [Treponema sp.]|nr:hypothetical protein [Treponema sp.]
MKFVRLATFLFSLFFLTFSLITCDLFNGAADPYLLDKLNEELAYSNAPWVPLRIVAPADLGTTNILPGQQLRTVKLGYSFKLVFVPAPGVPFQGWDAWVDGEGLWSSWRRSSGTSSPDIVNFVRLNSEGTEVEIFVYKMPPSGDLYIGPVGALAGTINNIQPSVGQPPLGSIFPGRLENIRPGYGFNMSFQPSAGYPFRGWQLRSGLSPNGVVFSTWTEGEGTVNNEQYDWNIQWVKRNASGTDISVIVGALPAGISSVTDIIIGPLGIEMPILNVATNPGGLGNIASTITQETPVRLTYAFTTTFTPSADYPFRGWQILVDNAVCAKWELANWTSTNAYSGINVESGWNVRWRLLPQGAPGTEMEITILSVPDSVISGNKTITIMSLDGDKGNVSASLQIPDTAWGVLTPLVGVRRQSFPFAIEFAPNASFAFTGWRAYAGSVAPGNLVDDDTIVQFGNRNQLRTNVTIHTDAAIILVPWCELRPAVSRSSPPLIPAISPFPYDQKITVWFNMNINHNTAVIGDTIKISAIYTTGQNNGQPFEADGDIANYFRISDYNSAERRLEISVKDDTAYPATHLQLLNISVAIAGIKTASNLEMAAPQTITYLTDTSKAQKIYEASNIRASRNGTSYFSNYNTVWQDNTIDRRFNQGKIAPYDFSTVHLSFSVITPEGVTQTPDRFYVYERMYADIAGYSLHSPINNGPYEYLNLVPTNNVYTIIHPLGTGRTDQHKPSGIMQLIIVPWNDSYRDENGPIRQERDAAFAAGHFVTVVMDNAAPGVNDIGAVLTGGALNNGVYNFARNTSFTLTMNELSSLADNSTLRGIHYTEAFNRPWTMDEWNNLQWRVTVPGVVISGVEVEITSGWQSVEQPAPHFTRSLIGWNENPEYTLLIEFRDMMGNVGSVPSASSPKFRIVSDVPVPVTGLVAACAETDTGTNRTTTITVQWILPAVMDRAILTMTDFPDIEKTRTGTGAQMQEHTFTVPSAVISGVRDGQAVNNVIRYDISVVAHNAAGSSSAVNRRIWNVPGMNVSETVSITEINTPAGLAAMPANATGQYALTSNITMTSHIPINNFRGRFYGNGHTIRMEQNVFGNNLSNIGIFGITGIQGSTTDNTVIRDLTVEYANVTVTGWGTTWAGGITGQANGNTKILNCIVKSITESNILRLNTTARAGLGGIAGFMRDTSSIENSLAALNVTLDNISGANEINSGGVVGRIEGSGIAFDNRANISYVTSIGTVSMNKVNNVGGLNFCGGIAGAVTRANLSNCIFGGKINVGNISSDGDVLIGGLAGAFGSGTRSTGTHIGYVYKCKVTGSISVRNYGNAPFLLGGVVGHVAGTNNNNRVMFEDTEYSAGEIYVEQNGEEGIRVGGFVGQLRNFGDFINCHSYAASITASTTNIITTTNHMIGGFAAEMLQSDIYGCSSSSNIIVPATHAATGDLFVGGFVGTMALQDDWPSSLTNCFATGSITVESSNPSADGVFVIGGLVGRSYIFYGSGFNTINRSYATGDIIAISSNIIISPNSAASLVGGLVGNAQTTHIRESFATGNVTARKGTGGDGNIAAGGLVGFIETQSLIENSYALGNVIADNPNTANAVLYAGGLIGNMNINASNSVTRSFAAGSVSARNASVSATTRAGGLVGWRNNGQIQNNAALGASVTAQGGGTRVAARIYGNPTTNIGSGNYARDTMRLEVSDVYNTFHFPFWNGEGADPAIYYRYPASTGFTTPNGENAAESAFRNQAFWQSGLNNLSGSITFHTGSPTGTRISRTTVDTPIFVNYSGNENITFVWQRDGVNISPTVTTSSYTPTQIGRYTIIATNSSFSPLHSASITVTNETTDPAFSGFV